jgi:hypothetical protein
MALTSPGVQVSVIDESFYTPAEPGTRPLFIVASAQDKTNGAGTGTAQGTLAANAGKVYLITSQRDLVDTFGDPTFRVDANNNPIHAGELNEYGLQAAYSYLGVSNSAFVVRADLNLEKLVASADAPGGDPEDGTFWLDSDATTYGIFEWNGAAATSTGGQSFNNKVPTIVTTGLPSNSVGAVGSYAVAYNASNTTTGHLVKLYYKSAFDAEGDVGTATWVQVGTDGWVRAHPVIVPTDNGYTPGAVTTGQALSVSVNGAPATTISPIVATTVAGVADAINSSGITTIGARVVNGRLNIFAKNNNVTSIKISSASPTIIAELGMTAVAAQIEPFYAPKLKMSAHTDVPLWKKNKSGNTPRPTGSVWIKTTEPNLGSRWRVKVYNSGTQLWEEKDAPLYATNQAALAAIDPSNGGSQIPVNSVYVQYNYDEYPLNPAGENGLAEFRVMRRSKTGATVIKTVQITSTTLTGGPYTINMAGSVAGTSTLDTGTVTFTATGATTDALALATAINTANIANIEASVTTDNRVQIQNTNGGDIRFADLGDSDDTVSRLGLISQNTNVYLLDTAGRFPSGDNDTTYEYVASNWIPRTFAGLKQSYFIDTNAPTTLVADGELWYSSVVDEVDLMVHDGDTWVGYGNFYGDTDPAGPIVSASQPTTFADGTTAIDDAADGQIWIDTSDIENYPVVKRWNGDTLRWEILDKSDQTTENGVLFADARWATDGDMEDASTIADLWTSDFLDFDAPDPALYPRGMILFNLRRSGFNVKRFKRNYVDLQADNGRQGDESMENYYPHRWVTESGNQADGSGSFGRHAQRKVIIQALQALVNSNEDIRDTEVRGFNLMACPGYSELIGEMVNLNYDRGLTAFVVGDTPARLTPDATTINDWGNNVALSLQDDDNGLVSYDEYLGVFYPWGFTSDNAGRDVAVPPSHMICRMIALNDQVAYPWFAPAGTRRGGITNATAVGYVTGEGEFQSIALNEGQRDTLYNVKVNPITFFTGAGLVNFGQKTRARNASALDRINVARLVIYLRSQLNKLAKPYIFEPNDKITRDEIKQQVESLLLELVGQRALYDFLVVCDESNNTPNRIDRNELYVDIAIEPVKAVEFIYIPVRLKNTGEIAGL